MPRNICTKALLLSIGILSSVIMKKKIIGYATRGFAELPLFEQVLSLKEFADAVMEKDDWLYSLRDGKVYAQINEEGTYTIMLSEEY
jgi:hypothetical protein